MSTLLQTSGLSFSYGANQVLRDIRIHLYAGEVVALLGPNGSGKSTLIKSLIGFLRATGEISWNDKPLNKWSRRELAQQVAYLAQSPLHEPGQTVREALQLGRAPYWHLFGIESMRDAEVVAEVSHRLGLEEILDRPMERISGGQRQMVFVGRALVQEPKAVLLDEPNTFLDLKHQVELMSLLRQLAQEKNVGVLMASHDLNLAAASSDELVLLDRGAVVADGKPTEVLNPATLVRVYGVEMERIDRPDRAPVIISKS